MQQRNVFTIDWFLKKMIDKNDQMDLTILSKVFSPIVFREALSLSEKTKWKLSRRHHIDFHWNLYPENLTFYHFLGKRHIALQCNADESWLKPNDYSWYSLGTCLTWSFELNLNHTGFFRNKLSEKRGDRTNCDFPN